MISVGIDIGSFSVKIAEVESTPRGFSLNRFHEFPLSQDPNKDQSIEVLDILRNLFAQYDLTHTRIVFGEKQSHVSSRILTFPFRERHKILKALPIQLEEDIPFSDDDALYDAKIISFEKNLAHVLALACPREKVQKWYQLASDSGITADLLSVEGVAYCNLLENWELPPPEIQETPDLPESEPAELHLHIGHKHSLLVIRTGGRLRALRSIDWGGRNIIETVARKYSLHYLDASKEVRSKAFVLLNNDGATKDQVAFSDSIKSSIDELAHELKLTIFDIESELNLKVSQAFLSGTTALMKGFGPYLTQKLEVSFNRLRYLNLIANHQLEDSPEIETKAVVAVGLAMEGLKKPRNPAVNLFKGEFEKKSQDLQKTWQKWKHTAQVSLAIFVALIVWGVWRENLAQQLSDNSYAQLKKQAENVAGLKGTRANIRNINKFLMTQELLEKNRDLAEKAKDINSAFDLLREVSVNVPASRQMELDVTRFKVEQNFLEIMGHVANIQQVNNLRQSLENIAADKKVQSLPGTKAPAGKQAFGFRIRVDRMRGT